jgi:hypothetical protein
MHAMLARFEMQQLISEEKKMGPVGKTTAVVALLLSNLAYAQLPGEGPRLGYDRITQAEIESGAMSLHQIRVEGLKVFSTPFNKLDGYGDGPMDPSNTTDPGGRPTLQGNGTFLRVNGLDGQTCLECHSIVSNASVPAKLGVGGVGGSVTNAIFQPTFIDMTDTLHLEQAAMDGRFINPPFLFGSGGIELIAKEMTAELQALKQRAQQNPLTPIALETKGVSFGELLFDGANFDYSAVEGIDDDLVVKPFGRKGEFATVREFDDGAMMFHFGMQPVEVVGEDVDEDEDGVANEVLEGEISALVIFNTTLDRPIEDRRSANAKWGFDVFSSVGCVECHIPTLTSNSRVLTYSFPEVREDPSANIYYEVDLTRAPASFSRAKGGGLKASFFADLKRHNMGPGLAESFGSNLDAMFTTARLWGVADTAPYMHDGRALTLGEAILMHGGEAQSARDQYAALEEEDQARLLEFLLSLRTPRNPANDLTVGNGRK